MNVNVSSESMKLAKISHMCVYVWRGGWMLTCSIILYKLTSNERALSGATTMRSSSRFCVYASLRCYDEDRLYVLLFHIRIFTTKYISAKLKLAQREKNL